MDLIAKKYKDILEITEPYLLTYPENVSEMNLSPFGLEIPKKNIFSCIDAKKAHFFDNLQTLDKHSFGPVGMPMEKWVFFDCGEMVGGIFGLGIRGKNLHPAGRAIYNIEDGRCDDDLIPISMYIAIPMAKKGSWFGHNLCSANAFLGDKYPLAGLALLTKAFGVKCFNYTDAYGATQWESGSLNIHLQLADMDVLSAYTPAHSFSKTMTYHSVYTDEILLAALSGNQRTVKKCDIWVDASKDGGDEYFIDLQKKIEAGEKFRLIGRPVFEGKKTLLPMNKIQ